MIYFQYIFFNTFCGYCVKSLGLSGSSRKTKRAKRTQLFCIGCEMYLCAACQIKFKIHSNAMKNASKVAKELVKSLLYQNLV
jgi:hypothetical protein